MSELCCFCKLPAYGIYMQRPMCGACIDALEAPKFTTEQVKSFAIGEYTPQTDLEAVALFQQFLRTHTRPPEPERGVSE